MATLKGATTSVAAAELQISRLSDADLLRLERFARFQVFRYSSITAKDVLGEAVRRVLDGSRTWPTDVPFNVFLCNVIRSVAHEFRGQARRELEISGEAAESDAHANPEAQAADRELLEAIWQLFDGDQPVQALLKGIEEGLSAKEVQRRHPLSENEYDAARKRLERTLLRNFPSGMKS